MSSGGAPRGRDRVPDAEDGARVCHMLTAHEALQRLQEGNIRFTLNVRGAESFLSQERRVALTNNQEPFAIILGCADSRVPAEIVFDQGLGDLFVIRIAGNIVAPSGIGSVEFAAARFGTPLVVVLGHSRCGAILATLEELQRPTENQSRNLRSIVDRVRPSVEGLLAANPRPDLEQVVREAVRANIRASVANLRKGSEILEQLVQEGRLTIVGAEYSLETGVVDFFEGLSPPP
jgi:carbonic anhydrase